VEGARRCSRRRRSRSATTKYGTAQELLNVGREDSVDDDHRATREGRIRGAEKYGADADKVPTPSMFGGIAGAPKGRRHPHQRRPRGPAGGFFGGPRRQWLLVEVTPTTHPGDEVEESEDRRGADVFQTTRWGWAEAHPEEAAEPAQLLRAFAADVSRAPSVPLPFFSPLRLKPRRLVPLEGFADQERWKEDLPRSR